MRRAQVLDCGLQEQLWPHMESLRPRPSVYIPEFIAANQTARADNLIPGTRAQQVGIPDLLPGLTVTCSHGHMVSPFGNNTYTPGPKPLDNLRLPPPTLPPPFFPSWNKSERTLETSDPVPDWTRSSCCGPPIRNASARWSQVAMTQLKTCCVLSRCAFAQDSWGSVLVQSNQWPTTSLPSAWPGGVTVHTFCCGQHPGGLRLPQRVPTEHTGAWCPGAGFPAPCVRRWR